jgi:hypothetical protein
LFALELLRDALHHAIPDALEVGGPSRCWMRNPRR